MIIRSSDFSLTKSIQNNDPKIPRDNSTTSTSDNQTSHSSLVNSENPKISLFTNVTQQIFLVDTSEDYNSFYGLKTFLILFAFLVIGVIYAIYKSKCQTSYEMYIENMIRKSQEENNVVNEWKRTLVRRRFRERIKSEIDEVQTFIENCDKPKVERAVDINNEKVEAWLACQTFSKMTKSPDSNPDHPEQNPKMYSFFISNAKHLCNHENEC